MYCSVLALSPRASFGNLSPHRYREMRTKHLYPLLTFYLLLLSFHPSPQPVMLLMELTSQHYMTECFQLVLVVVGANFSLEPESRLPLMYEYRTSHI